MELKEFTSDKPVAFDPPEEMFVWDYERDNPSVATVMAYIPAREFGVISEYSQYLHCAEIPNKENT